MRTICLFAQLLGLCISCSAAPSLIKVPFVRQSKSYTCGVAASESVLGYYGEDNRESTLADTLQTSEQTGTSYMNIAKLGASKGYNVVVFDNEKQNDSGIEHKPIMDLKMLQSYLDKKIPVIVLIQAWSEKKVDYAKDWDDGHYVVAIGYDNANVYFMDPATLGNYTYIPVREFMTRWHDIDGKDHRVVHFGLAMWKNHPAYNSQQLIKME